MWRWIAVAVVCVLVLEAGPSLYAAWEIRQYARHACEALDVLTAAPVHPPANPAAMPAREQVYRLYLGLDSWARADGCR